MRSLNMSRVWIAGAAVIGLILVVATYLLVVAPARSDAASVQSQVEDASLTQATLRTKLHELDEASKDLHSLQATRAAALGAIPVTPDTQGLIRQVQSAATANRATFGAVAISEATTTDVDGVFSLPVTIELHGAPTDLVAVVTSLQGTTGRALSISGTTLDVVADSSATLSLDVAMYCTTDPAVVAGDPAATGAGTGGSAAATTSPSGGTATTNAS